MRGKESQSDVRGCRKKGGRQQVWGGVKERELYFVQARYMLWMGVKRDEGGGAVLVNESEIHGYRASKVLFLSSLPREKDG